MDMVHMLERAFDATGEHVAALQPDDRDRPTPCPEWTVHDLMAHIVGVVAGFRAAAAGDPPDGLAPGKRGEDLIAASPADAYRRAASDTLEAWRARGSLDGTVEVQPGQDMPAQAAIGINFSETLVHGWDLATALGRDATIEPELATAGLAVARQIVRDDVRQQVGFRPAITVPDDASPTDKLVAFLGRQP